MIGRIEEKKRLLNALESDESQFIAVYGRRRVGKTYLIRETFSRKNNRPDAETIRSDRHV